MAVVTNVAADRKGRAPFGPSPLSENQFSALVSFTYNVGSGNLQCSTLRMKLNKMDMAGAAKEFPKWRQAGGRILPGLVRHRIEERRLWEEPVR